MKSLNDYKFTEETQIRQIKELLNGKSEEEILNEDYDHDFYIAKE